MWMLKTQLVFTFFLLSKFQFISYTYSPGQDVKIQYMTAYYLSTHERVNPNLHGLSVGQFKKKKKKLPQGKVSLSTLRFLLHYCTMILQRFRIIVGDVGFDRTRDLCPKSMVCSVLPTSHHITKLYPTLKGT